MFDKYLKRRTQTDDALTRVYARMETLPVGSPEYATALLQAEKLTALKTTSGRKPVDPNTLLLLGGHLGGIVIIVLIEQRSVWTSQAKSFLPKLLK